MRTLDTLVSGAVGLLTLISLMVAPFFEPFTFIFGLGVIYISVRLLQRSTK